MLHYTVKRGDTLSKIAHEFHVSLRNLEAANPQIHDYNRIYPGEVINIPRGGSGNYNHYTVRTGDTLSKIVGAM